MSYEIVTTKDFMRVFKRLAKKYRSMGNDYKVLIGELLANPTSPGDYLGGGVHKVRMAIASKKTGKRGGARVITCNVLVDVRSTEIYLLTIYDKSEQDTISQKDIDNLKKQSGL